MGCLGIPSFCDKVISSARALRVVNPREFEYEIDLEDFQKFLKDVKEEEEDS